MRREILVTVIQLPSSTPRADPGLLGSDRASDGESLFWKGIFSVSSEFDEGIHFSEYGLMKVVFYIYENKKYHANFLIMQCAAFTLANLACGISTKNIYCHIHAPKFAMENEKMEGLMMMLEEEKSKKIEALVTNQQLKDKVEELLVERTALMAERYTLKQTIRDETKT